MSQRRRAELKSPVSNWLGDSKCTSYTPSPSRNCLRRAQIIAPLIQKIMSLLTIYIILSFEISRGPLCCVLFFFNFVTIRRFVHSYGIFRFSPGNSTVALQNQHNNEFQEFLFFKTGKKPKGEIL